MIAHLIRSGAEVDQKDKGGATALSIGATLGSLQVLNTALGSEAERS